MDDLGVPLFLETPIYVYIHTLCDRGRILSDPEWFFLLPNHQAKPMGIQFMDFIHGSTLITFSQNRFLCREKHFLATWGIDSFKFSLIIYWKCSDFTSPNFFCKKTKRSLGSSGPFFSTESPWLWGKRREWNLTESLRFMVNYINNRRGRWQRHSKAFWQMEMGHRGYP